MSTALSGELAEIEGVVKATELDRDRRDREEIAWDRILLEGRIGELSGSGETASLSAAFSLIRDSQAEGEPAAWVAAGESSFFPPDARRNGVDLEALPVIRVEAAPPAARAADKLLRSGGFGLIVIDLVSASGDTGVSVPRPLQKRLARHTDAHEAAILALTEKESDAPSFGSLCTFRAQSTRSREGGNQFEVDLEALADNRFGPGWTVQEVYRGPPGLR
jgi:recombination protein RecA